MEIDTKKQMTELYSGEAGFYKLWDPSKLPVLAECNIGAAKLCLKKDGFALPHYADSSKLAYVLQGDAVAGLVVSDKEKVVALKKGDAVALPFGRVSWWYNKEDTDLIVVFLGGTSTGHTPGVFTYFFLTGSIGVLTGFSTDFLTRAWGLPEDVVKTLVTSQDAPLMTKLDESSKMPEPKEEDRHGLVFNCEEAPLDVDVKNGGRLVVVTPKNLPLLGQMGLGAELVWLDPGALCSPRFSSDSALQVTYIVKGSGRVQVVGAQGERVLDAIVKAGDLLIVPRFFVVSQIADDEGLEWFSVITSPEPSITQLAGKTSAWKALSPQVLTAAFNVPKDIERHFRSASSCHAIFFPPN